MTVPLPIGVPYVEGGCQNKGDVSSLQAVIVSADEASWVLGWPAAAPENLAFFLRGRPYAALDLTSGEPSPLSLVEFFEPFRKQTDTRFALYEIELPLLLALLTLGAHKPTTLVPAAAVDLEALLADLRSRGDDSVVALDAGDRTVLGFALKGKLVRLYDGQSVLTGLAADERLLELALTSTEADLGIYTDIRVAPDPLGEEPLRKLLTSDFLPGRLMFRIDLGEGGVTEVERAQERISIGRSPGSDIVVAHPSVSRDHCELRWRGDGYEIADLGSTSGTTVRGEPPLTPFAPTPFQEGDRMTVGHVHIRTGGSQSTDIDPMATMMTPPGGGSGGEGLGEATVAPYLIHRDRVVLVKGQITRVGSLTTAEVRIEAAAAVACLISADGRGGLLLLGPTDGSVLLKGQRLPGNTVPLDSGDVISVAGEPVVFVRMVPPAEEGGL